MEAKPKKGFYNKERYERNKGEILKNRRAKYRTQQNKDLGKICNLNGHLLCILIRFFSCIYYMIYIMYVLICKENGNQCNVLNNLLDAKEIQCTHTHTHTHTNTHTHTHTHTHTQHLSSAAQFEAQRL